MRSIVHLDADAFFASVEQAADLRLRGRPVAVGGEKRGIIASASYEARRFGIYTPMPTARARKLCPKLIILPGDFEKYEQFSRWMFSYAYDFTPDVEITSIDEGYFDLTANRKSPCDIAETIRRAIRETLKITVSEGIATNKLVSQIASKLHKPAAFLQVAAGGEKLFLHPLRNRWLPGVGPKTGARLDAAGLALVGQIAATPLDLLHLLMGNMAPQLKDFANAQDDRPILPVSAPAKSYSQQETFAADTTNEEFVEALLHRQADELMRKVRQDTKSIRTLTVKVRYNDMAEEQCSESLLEPTDLETDLYPRLRPMLCRAWRRRVSLRMVSLRLSNVYDTAFRSELPLERAAVQHEARRRLAQVVDELRQTRRPRIILRGHDFILEPRFPRSKTDPAARDGRPIGQEDKRLRENDSYPKRQGAAALHDADARTTAPIPLAIHSYYSFLDSTLSINAIIELAKRYELPALALTDSGNLHGAVELAPAAQVAGIKPIIGTELLFDRTPLHLYVQNQKGYANLCRILTQMSLTLGDKRETPRRLEEGRRLWPAVFQTLPNDGLLAASPDPRWAALFPDRFYLEINRPDALRQLDKRSPFPVVATLPIHYATPEDRLKFDIVQSIRTLTLLRQAHPAKRLDGDFHFRNPGEMRRLFGSHPELLVHSLEIAERCSFQFNLGRPQFPPFTPPDGSTPAQFLRRLALAGAEQRYLGKAASVKAQLEEELAIIAEVGYEEYFLVVWDLLQECRRHGIDWITRGSAADSLVCYCLGISNVCPIRFKLYFRRFLNKDRMRLNKLPDIDIDFPHDRKDDVIHLLFQKYGAEHMAVVGGFSTFQARSAVAEVAKVLGVSEIQIRRFTEHFPWASAQAINEALRRTQECRDLPLDEEPYSTALKTAAFLDGFPRYAKMHPCGVVLSRQPISELSPTLLAKPYVPELAGELTTNSPSPLPSPHPMGRGSRHLITHFDMDSVEDLGLIKLDILAQGGLAAMRDVKETLATRGIILDLEKSAGQPWDDPHVWELIASGGARAVHHIESPAMISLCRMCNVREIDGLVAIVSVIRPGAANEQKKARFVRRYQGLEAPVYPHPCLEESLKSTYGLVVYEEHILQMCEDFAGLPPGRADVLRRALGKRKEAVILEIKEEFHAAARARGHDPKKIAEVWELINGFAGYAFCKAHSTAYAVEAYQSAWLKKYYPAEFMAAVLSNGKGFYHPIVYVLECHHMGIPLLPPWVNQPGPGFMPVTQGPRNSIRVPITRVKGLTSQTKDKIIDEFARGLFGSMRDFHQRVHPLAEEMEALIRVGAFDGFGQSRTSQFWEAQYLQRAFQGDASGQGWLLPPPNIQCPPQTREPTRQERLLAETELLDFPASSHPLELHSDIAWDTYCPVSRLGEFTGQEVTTCGLVIEQRIHHQVTGEPMKFLTLADWTGIVETELFAATYRSYGLATVRYPVLEITARVEPYENGLGHSLRVLRAGKPRMRPGANKD